MTKLGVIVFIRGRVCQICRNREGWFAVDVRVGASTEYVVSEPELLRRLRCGRAKFGGIAPAKEQQPCGA